jgi:hypothetical protein
MSKRNATASWSGYSHQGQIGILVALREMKRLFENNLQSQFNIHFLEYESFEDIAIYQEDNGNVEFLSVHQVKAYYSNGHLVNTYKDVFTENPIYTKDAENKKVQSGKFEVGQWCSNKNYLHTAVAIENWTDEYFTSIGGNPHSIERFLYKDALYHCSTTEIEDYILQELNTPFFHDKPIRNREDSVKVKPFRELNRLFPLYN